MDDIAIIEESVELLPEIGILLHSAVPSDPELSGLTLTQIKTIGFLYHHGEATITELSAGLAVGLPSVSEMIDRLEDRGFVSRSAGERDRRRVVVSLTEEWDAVARRIHDLRREQVRMALERLAPAERSGFLASLRVLADVLRESAVAPTRRD